MKHIQTFESFLNERKYEMNEAAKLRIAYTPIDKKAYSTQREGIQFSVKINNQTATGTWTAKYGDMTNGVDVNELKGSNGRFYIFSSGGSSRSFPISTQLEELERQPKDLRFTGPYLDLSKLKEVFIDKVTQAIENPSKEEQLTPEFLEYFGIQVEESLNEGKKITVITYGNKEHTYTDRDIQEFIKDPNLSADNLPSWMYGAALRGAQGFPKKPKEVVAYLEKILKHKGNVTINVASDKPSYQNSIVFEGFNEGKHSLESIDSATAEEFERDWNRGSKVSALIKLIKAATGKEMSDIPEKAVEEFDKIVDGGIKASPAAIKILDVLNKYD